MSFSGLSGKSLAMICGAAVLAGAVAVLVRPKSFENVVLGAQWQCSRTAFVLTTCSPRMQQLPPGLEMPSKVALRAPKL